MTNRVWLFTTMDADSALSSLVGERIHQSTSLDSTPSTKPFLMYRQTSDVQLMRGDDGDACRRVGYMIFAHDVPGDYMQIDSILAALRDLFADTNDQANGIIRSTWLETSDDLRDEDMGTIMKFARVEVTYRV